MGKKQLIWLFLLALFIGVPALIRAKSSKSQQMNSQGGDMQNNGSAYSRGYNQGYPQGYEEGTGDKAKGKCLDVDIPHVKYPHCGCHDEAAEHEFKGAFRAGFEQGYHDGYAGREQQSALAPDATSAPVETQTPAELARAEETETTSPSAIWQSGYKNGYEGGQADQTACKKSDYDDAPGYHDKQNVGCSKCMSKKQAERRYKAGFKQGYQDGYNGLVSRLATKEPAQPQAAAAVPEEQPRAENPPEAAPSQPSSPFVEATPPVQETPPTQATPPSQETPPAQETRALPKALPKTASNLPLIGLVGLAGISLSLISRALRRTGRNDAA